MNKIIYVVIGVALIAIGAYREFGMSEVSDQDQARCEQNVRSIYGDESSTNAMLIESCDEAGFVAMMDSRVSGDGAEAAAQNIASANKGGIISTLINCAILGAGIGAIGAAFGARRKRA